MTQKDILKDKVTAMMERVIPTEFYDVREEIAPKAGWLPMYSLTSVVYIAAIIAFVLLYVNEKQKGIVETIITSYDYDGKDGYTCQMISYATSSNPIPATTEPTFAYNLANVMESKSDCEKNLQIANPCAKPLTFFPGAAPTNTQTENVVFSGAVLYGNETTFSWYALDGIGGFVFPYNYAAGYVNGQQYSHPEFSFTASLAVDRNGSPVYLGTESLHESTKVYRSLPNNGSYQLLYDTGVLSSVYSILNDNLYNVYMIQNNSFVVLDIYDTPVTSTVLFTSNVTTEENILCAAVYHDGVFPTVYYTTASSGGVVFVYRNNVTDQISFSKPVKGLAVDGDNNLFAIVLQFTQYLLVDGTGKGAALISEAPYPPRGFGINPAGTRIMITVTRPDVGFVNPQVGFFYPRMRSADGGYAVPYQLVQYQTSFGAGWFVCGDQILNATAYSPAAPAEYPQACALNGIVGKVVYSNSYLFTDTDVKAFATTNAVPYCTGLYQPIIDKVSRLPPYSCSRTLNPTFFACLGTAFANTTFLMQLMIFVFALMLPKLALRFPVPAPIDTGKQQMDVEMTHKNPMQ